MKRYIAAILAMVLVLMLCPFANAEDSGSEYAKILQSETYWEMTVSNYDTENTEVDTYYVRLMDQADCSFVYIVSEACDDLVYEKYGWYYDAEDGLLHMDFLADPWNPGMFLLKDGSFESEGAYHKVVLTRTAGAQNAFHSCLNRFRQQYGSMNPIKRLTVSDNSFRYRDIAEMYTMPYDMFKYIINIHSNGLVKSNPTAESSEEIMGKITPLLGANTPRTFQYIQVHTDATLPETDEGYFTSSKHVDIVNLVADDLTAASKMLYSLSNDFSTLLGAKSIGSTASANDMIEGRYEWSETNAVAAVQMGYSVLVFCGPKEDVQSLTEQLNLDAGVWDIPIS